jgi:ABC-2 type transport system ATP-binding protein
MTMPLPTPQQPTIEVARLAKWYGDVVAVADVSFQIGPGVTGLLGPNGAGKSTTFKMLTGLLRPSAGEIRILGRPARGDSELYRQIGLVGEQDATYPFLTGYEFVRLNAALYGLADLDGATRRALDLVDLTADGARKTGGYSKGMRQRVKIAAALVHDPQIVIMDEPLNGTDPVQRVQIIELIQRLGAEGRTVVISSHILHEVERFAERILVIVHGRLAAAGDFRAIRDLITEQARQIRVRASDPRRLAAALVGLPSLRGLTLDGDSLVLEIDDPRDCYWQLPRLAKAANVRLYEIGALDDSLASVFSYVVGQ